MFGKLIEQRRPYRSVPGEQLIEQLPEITPSYKPRNLQELPACKMNRCKHRTNVVGDNRPHLVGFVTLHKLDSISDSQQG